MPGDPLAMTAPTEPCPWAETTISAVHAAMAAGTLSCQTLTQMYLERIARYDQSSGLNAIVLTHPHALERAAALDAAWAEGRSLGALHGVPVIVKDNYHTADLQTTAGSKALAGFVPADDAYLVRRLRDAGAVILAKANMAEWAFSPYQTISSIAGVTRNAYDLSRVPAGSSGGTAAAVAANFGLVGLGTDTGNSIRGPAAHLSLVGLRPTLGLTSRAGIIPLYRDYDTGGPMTRSVADTARLLGVIAGYDPADPLTQYGHGHIPQNYLAALDAQGLQGARIGVLPALCDQGDAEVTALFEQALQDLAQQGAAMIQPLDWHDLQAQSAALWRDTFHYDINAYLAATEGIP